jgi:hypothetical protein
MRTAPDPEILAWAAERDRIVLSHDARTMPLHAIARLREALALPGVVIVPQRLPTGRAIADLELLAGAGEEADFRDQVVYLPL